MTKPTLLILKGLPASGKSVYANNLVKNGMGQWKRVNKDDLRNMIDAGKWSGERENGIIKVRNVLIALWLSNNKNVIVDDTNFHKKHIISLQQQFSKQADVVIEFIDTPLTECITRDVRRPSKVGHAVILRMYNKYLNKSDKPVTMKSLGLNPYQERYIPYREQVSFKRPAIICDIDGTLALIGPRSPYDGSKVHLDSVNEPVADLLLKLQSQYEIILLSGREGTEECRRLTENWLTANCIPWHKLIMRQEGDNRKDSIIKREIFEQDIEPNFLVKFVLDDRDQVVQMWREELKLPCFQVNYGNF